MVGDLGFVIVRGAVPRPHGSLPGEVSGREETGFFMQQAWEWSYNSSKGENPAASRCVL